METWEKTACEMLGIPDCGPGTENTLPSNLHSKLRRIDALCKRVNGGLVSRQTIAMIIDDCIEVKQ